MQAILYLPSFLIMLTVNCLTNKVFFRFFVLYMHQKGTLSIAVVSEKVMAGVDMCPQNLTGVNEASRKLGCGLDQYGNNRYLCLPNVEKTSLVEFCFNGTMGYFEKGHCLQTSGGNLTLESCLKFSSGCPEYEFKSTDFYNYAACQELNLKYNCYKFDRHCPPQSIENTNYEAIVAGLIVGLIVLIIISLSSYFLWKRLKKRKEEEYTFQRGLTYCPLVVQKDFRPDGWLSKIQKDVKQFDSGLEKEKEILQMLEQFRTRYMDGEQRSSNFT